MNTDMGMARILFVNSWSSCHGGSSTSLIDIVAHIDRNRFDPLVLCPEPGELPERLAELGIPVVLHRITSATKRHCFRFLCETAWYCRLLRRCGIRLVHANTGCWRKSVVLAARLSRIPFVQHVRNPVRNVHSNFAYRFARLIITNSDHVGQPFRDAPKFRKKAKTVYNAVDLSAYDGDEDRRGELQAGDCPVIGFVGHVSSAKGVATLIHAMQTVLEAFPKALLVVVGCGVDKEPEYESECRALIQKIGIDSSVIFAGYRRDVPAWMRTFDVFVLPTKSETFGKVVVEAMAAGCPVVASAVGGIPEIISHPGVGTLVPPDDPRTIAREIIRFLADRELAGKVGTAARRHVRERFGLSSMVRNLERLYDEVLNHGSGGPVVQ